MKTKLSLILLISGLLVLSYIPNAVAKDYPQGMVSYWKLDEESGTIASDSIDGNDGTIYGAIVAIGKVGNALNFDGMDDYIDCGDVPNLDISNAITIEAWINTSTTKFSIIASKDDDGSNREYYLGLLPAPETGRIRWALKTSSFQDIDSATTVNDGDWHHIVGTYDGSNIRLYIDSVEDDNSPVAQTGVIPNTNVSFKIGYKGDLSLDHWFDGIIDEVAVCNRALTVKEIQKHYQNGLQGLGYEIIGVKPVADAGQNQIADTNETIILDGSASYDPDGSVETYTWTRFPDNVVLYSGSGSTYETKALGRVEEVISLTVIDDEGIACEEPDIMSILNRKVSDTAANIENIERMINPTFQITSPADGSEVSGVVTIGIMTNKEENLKYCSLSVDNRYTGWDNTAPFSFNWDSRYLENGEHTIKVMGYFRNGVYATKTATITVTINNDPIVEPSISITSPEEGQTVSGTITVSTDATDEFGTVYLYVDGRYSGYDGTEPFEFSYDTTTLSNGTHYLGVRGYHLQTRRYISSNSVSINVNN